MDKQHKIDALFEKAQLTPTAIPFSESKSSFIRHVEAGAPAPKGKFRFINLKNFLIMIGIVGILSLIVNVSISGNTTTEVERQTPETQQEVPTNNDFVKKLEPQFEVSVQKIANKEAETWVDFLQPIPFREIYPEIELVLQYRKGSSSPPRHVSQASDYVPFPKLTEKEIAANHKQKKKMIKALSKFSKKEYAYIPSGSFSYKEVEVSVQAFYIQRMEVTNLQYRTFLFDLLIQGRKDDFLLAAPDQTLWTRTLDDSLVFFQNEYFSNSGYNYSPVVNVSKKGAEMYCKWITSETNKTKKENFINNVRVPQLVEWTYAASNLGKQVTYPWEGEELSTDGMFNANFKLDEYEGDLSLIKRQITTRLDGRTTFEYSAGSLLSWTQFYAPNEMGIYHMSGNVAEMVSMRMHPENLQDKKPTENQVVTCGGSWMSPVEDLKIYNERISDNINGHPSIGFRVVVTHFQPAN